MSHVMPEGEDLRRAVKWISAQIQENPDSPVGPFVQEATFRFDLSPKDADFLIRFFSKGGEGAE